MDDLQTYYDAAVAQHRAGNIAAAEATYRQILDADRFFARAWHLLGVLLHQRGETATAIEYIERAIGLEPQWSVFYSNLANVYWTAGRMHDAERAVRQALELEPASAASLITLGQVLQIMDRCDEAIGVFQQALTISPNATAALAGLAHANSEVGFVEQAIDIYRKAAKASTDPVYRIHAATQLPLVYQSREELLAWRERLTREVDSLLAEGVSLDLQSRVATPIFSLAHQGLNDLEIQRKLARLYRAPALPPPTVPNRPDGRIRVGFVSSYFNEHTIGKLTRGLITGLSRRDFHVTVFSVGQRVDPVAREIAASADRFVIVPRDLQRARQALIANGVHVLVYTDIGMDQTTYSLAMSRLAPVQCTTWGHPETTGLDTIDYFVSSEPMELPDADAHYSERLVRLPGLTLCFTRSQLPPQLAGRATFDLDPTKRLYASPQSIYKFHPDFDAALAGILRGDPEGQIVLIRWAYPQADAQLRERFARVMPDVADRIVFIRRLQQPEFMNFLTLIDVLLDPFPYGGGNSSLEGFSFGVPVVTLPTEFLRGRITQAFCRRLGIESCIAKNVVDYVDIAVRLGNDGSFRRQICAQIAAGQSRLFGDPSAIADWERFLHAAADEKL
jgi:predicted O-linked N-acetylglucosamine transferase (SPINDLY family)